MPSAGLVSEAQVIGQAEPARGGPLGPLDWRKVLPFEPCAASDSLGGGPGCGSLPGSVRGRFLRPQSYVGPTLPVGVIGDLRGALHVLGFEGGRMTINRRAEFTVRRLRRDEINLVRG